MDSCFFFAYVVRFHCLLLIYEILRLSGLSAILGISRTKNIMLDKKDKDKVIEKYKTHAGDTGSPEVQIALLSEEVKRLAEHLKEHKKDFSSRRGLLKKIGQRHRLLKYLSKESAKRHEVLIDKLKLKKKETKEVKKEETVKAEA